MKEIKYLSTEVQKETINLTKELIKIPSSSKDGNEIYEFTADYLLSRGFTVEYQKISNPYIQYTNFSNLYIRIKNGDGPKILFNGHLDTVDAKEGWYYKPFSAFEEGNRIYGLGAADMKGGCAAAIQAFINFYEENKDFKGELFLSLVFGEEAPFSLGTDTLLREYDLSDYDLIIVTEPSPLLAINDYCLTHHRVHKSEFPVPILGAEGRVLFEIEFFGKSAHASHPSMGINALHDAAHLINELSKFDLFSNIKMGRGHYCVINIEGGDESFTVPGYSKILVNRQLTIGETAKSVSREIKQIIRQLNLKSKVNIKKRYSPAPELEYNPYIFDRDKYIEEFMDLVYKEVNGKENMSSKANGFNKGSCRFTTSSVGDFNLFGTRTKVPTLVFGPGGGNIHAPNEYVFKDEILLTTEYLLKFLERVYNRES